MAKPKKIGGPKQKLSPKAAARKSARDKRAANRKDRREKRADSQKKHRDNPSMKGKDYDHKDKKFKSEKNNRGNDGEGTIKEGKRKYRIKTKKRK